MGDEITKRYVIPSVLYKKAVLFIGPYQDVTRLDEESKLRVTSEVFADCYRRFPDGKQLGRHDRLVTTARFLSAWLRGEDYEHRDLALIKRDDYLEKKIMVAFIRKVGEDGLNKLWEGK